MGFKIPKDITVLGFNNENIGKFIEPSLSTIDLSAYDMGSAASEILIDQIKDPDHTVQKKLIKALLSSVSHLRENSKT